jgi:hypothetical protein
MEFSFHCQGRDIEINAAAKNFMGNSLLFRVWQTFKVFDDGFAEKAMLFS